MRDPFEMSLWKDIIKGGKDFSLKLAVRLSNDRLERFWWDRFTREFKLKDASLTLLISLLKKCYSLWDGGGQGGCWEA